MVKTYAVNTFDAWLNSEGDDISESYVKYQDYAALEEKMLALLDHPIMKAHTDALREAQITGLAFIRVNANGHVQALPSDRVSIYVIQAVEEQEARARVDQAAENLMKQDPKDLEDSIPNKPEIRPGEILRYNFERC